MTWMILLGAALLIPIAHLNTTAYFRNLLATRHEMYAVRDALGYKHWKTGMESYKAKTYRNKM